MDKKKVAIACQGGGSQTAFTAGVLKSLIHQQAFSTYDLVSISGTSGGAVCASLLWYSMLESTADQQPLTADRLTGFWRDNASHNPFEAALNDSSVALTKMIGMGTLPEWHMGVSNPLTQMATSTLQAMFPRFYDFQGLLEKHIDFDRSQQLLTADSPLLVVGAANVRTGGYRKFKSHSASGTNDISVEAILASTAVPSLFPAVEVDGEYYWDGLFSDNPPTDELIIDAPVKPDELWVIQINPTGRDTVPVQPEEIQDRRNEMIGNLSLFQDLNHILTVNQWIDDGAFTDEYITRHGLKNIDVFVITMSEELQKSLDYHSKLDRNAAYIDRLMADGELRTEAFLADKAAMAYRKR